MQHFAADCQRTESSIAIITAEPTDYSSFAVFYTVAIGQLLRDWWDVDPNTVAEIEDHTKALARTGITTDELLQAAESLLKITPINDYNFSRPEIAEAFNIRNEWNFREYGWIGDTEFGLLAWETSA